MRYSEYLAVHALSFQSQRASLKGNPGQSFTKGKRRNSNAQSARWLGKILYLVKCAANVDVFSRAGIVKLAGCCPALARIREPAGKLILSFRMKGGRDGCFFECLLSYELAKVAFNVPFDV